MVHVNAATQRTWQLIAASLVVSILIVGVTLLVLRDRTSPGAMRTSRVPTGLAGQTSAVHTHQVPVGATAFLENEHVEVIELASAGAGASGAGGTPGQEVVTSMLKVCFLPEGALPEDATLRVGRMSWSATSGDGIRLQPSVAATSRAAFPADARLRPDECAEGALSFVAPPNGSVFSILYRSTTGEEAVFRRMWRR